MWTRGTPQARPVMAPGRMHSGTDTQQGMETMCKGILWRSAKCEQSYRPITVSEERLTVKLGLGGVLKVVDVSPNHLPVNDKVALLVDHVRNHEHLHAAPWKG